MIITQKENYTSVVSDEAAFQEFYTSFSSKLETLKEHHLIVQVSENLNTSEQDISLFLNVAEAQKENGMSFVVVCAAIDNDIFPEHFNIVPTFVEAEDIIQMEAIERDLGF
ncbi:hypothetical protein RQM59_10860 [Flavobacteriaceae bacterium S356]|uniref:Uncharacterized protein n=1 Tax=Asprobacillus argus TaxID=3076534 RepID=A0ABU3LGQ1_9FLAO|nr:hypothetical protein [Flavobacteriaceae bacterium S356]